jgi:hypothetical protein
MVRLRGLHGRQQWNDEEARQRYCDKATAQGARGTPPSVNHHGAERRKRGYYGFVHPGPEVG